MKTKYIIRKQEIGNRKGIIDTDFSETLMKADGENFEYEQIATKLDKTSKIGIHWVQNGKFEWNGKELELKEGSNKIAIGK